MVTIVNTTNFQLQFGNTAGNPTWLLNPNGGQLGGVLWYDIEFAEILPIQNPPLPRLRMLGTLLDNHTYDIIIQPNATLRAVDQLFPMQHRDYR